MNTHNDTARRLHDRLHYFLSVEGLVGPLTFPEIEQARSALARIDDLDEMAGNISDDHHDAVIEATAVALAAGDLDLDAVMHAATKIEPATLDRANEIIDRAIGKIAADPLRDLNRIGDRWLPIMRPQIEKALAPLARLRKDLPEYPVFDNDLRFDLADNLRRIKEHYDTLFDLTASLVSPGGNRDSTRLRFLLHEDAYTGPDFPRGCQLSMLGVYYRAGCKPGIWTEQEVRDANRVVPLTTTKAKPSSRAVDDDPAPAA